MFCIAASALTLFGTYRRTLDIRFSISLAVAILFGLVTTAGLIWAIVSVQSTKSLTKRVESLVKELVLPISNFAHFLMVATEIIKTTREKDNLLTLSVTPALGEVLCPVLHMEYKKALVEMIRAKKVDVWFYHPECKTLLEQLKRWAESQTRDDTDSAINAITLTSGLYAFLCDMLRVSKSATGSIKSFVFQGISIPPFLLVLSSNEMVICAKPQVEFVKVEDFKGFHTKSKNIIELFQQAVLQLRETIGGSEYEISDLLETLRQASDWESPGEKS